jgi:hypothetical protein
MGGGELGGKEGGPIKDGVNFGPQVWNCNFGPLVNYMHL